MKNRLIIIFTAICLFLAISINSSGLSADFFERFDDFHSSTHEPFEIYNEDGVLLSVMARIVQVDDELIAFDGRHYRIDRVEDRRAFAVYVGEHDIALMDLSMSLNLLAQEEEEEQYIGDVTIGIFHTHCGESFLPCQGVDNIPGAGGILDVGEVFAETLEEKGFRVIHDTRSHEPHDAQAYYRSRRTAVDLIRQGAIVLIDVHRDGIPDPEFFRKEIGGEDVTQIRLVVGRQNQNMQSNLDFAKHIKAVGNEIHPGIVREIFMANGNYNQDIGPRVMLIEVGTYTNTKEEAKAGAELFAEIMPAVMGVAPGGGPTGLPTQGSDWSSIFWILTLTVMGIGGFLVISTGSWEGAVNKAKQFVTKEWANYIGFKGKNKQDDSNKK